METFQTDSNLEKKRKSNNFFYLDLSTLTRPRFEKNNGN